MGGQVVVNQQSTKEQLVCIYEQNLKWLYEVAFLLVIVSQLQDRYEIFTSACDGYNVCQSALAWKYMAISYYFTAFKPI